MPTCIKAAASRLFQPDPSNNGDTILLLAGLVLAAALPAVASENCKPHSLFTPVPGYHIYECESSEFDAKDVPVGINEDGEVVMKTVDGICQMVVYQPDEGAGEEGRAKNRRVELVKR